MPALNDYDAAQRIAQTHTCPDCRGKSRLVVKQHQGKDTACCLQCGRVGGFRRRESLTAQWRRNPDSIPNQIAEKLERKYGTPMTEQAIVTTTETAMVQRIEQARWLADLKPQDRQSLAHLAVKYGLDPLMKELTLYEGQPYISIAGLIRIAHRQKMFAGLEDRPMTQAERTQYGYKAPFTWIVNVHRKDWKCPATGTGTADPANPFRNNPIERIRPEWMARSRAMRQALKLAFPHSLPFEAVESAEEQGIDPETGEIMDAVAEPGEFSEAPEFDTADHSSPPIPELQDEEAAKADLREKIAAIVVTRNLSFAQLEAWSKKHCQCTYKELSLDGLIALAEALEAMKTQS